MKNIFKIVVIALSCITFAVAQNKKQEEGIFAEFNTSKGKIPGPALKLWIFDIWILFFNVG